MPDDIPDWDDWDAEPDMEELEVPTISWEYEDQDCYVV